MERGYAGEGMAVHRWAALSRCARFRASIAGLPTGRVLSGMGRGRRTNRREDAMSAALSRRRFSVAEYYCMGEAGILKLDGRTELIEVEIVVMPPIGPAHAEGNDRTSDSFRDRFRGWAAVRNENLIRRADFSQPDRTSRSS